LALQGRCWPPAAAVTGRGPPQPHRVAHPTAGPPPPLASRRCQHLKKPLAPPFTDPPTSPFSAQGARVTLSLTAPASCPPQPPEPLHGDQSRRRRDLCLTDERRPGRVSHQFFMPLTSPSIPRCCRSPHRRRRPPSTTVNEERRRTNWTPPPHRGRPSTMSTPPPHLARPSP
jgi:hypothetical protein